jgi:2-keto-3-deoxy-L-rhamnonate aldolase RhmA
MRFSSDRRLNWLATTVGVFVVGVMVLVLNVSAPVAQEAYVHVNPVIAKLSRGERVFGVPVTDLSLVNARALAREPLIDYITIDFEHSVLDLLQLEIFMAGLIDRQAIREKNSLEHNIAVFLELPQYSFETTVYTRKNALDIGVMGFVFSNLETKEDALRLVKSMRLRKPKGHPLFEPDGTRLGCGGIASWFWGLTGQQYTQRADNWPLNPQGDLLAFATIETELGLKNMDEIAQVPGIGVLYFTSGGDLGTSLGVPSTDPAIGAARQAMLKVCAARKKVCGGTVTTANIERLMADGYQLMTVNPGSDGGIMPETDAAIRLGRAALAKQNKK